MSTGSIFGKNYLQMGPSNIYIKPIALGSWDIDTNWIALGLTESVIFRSITSKGDLKASQKGDRPYDKVIISQQCQVEAGLGQASLETLEYVGQGISLIKDSNNVITQAMIVNKLGSRDRENLFWVKIVELDGNVESTDPLDSVYMLAAPSSDTVELTFDATTQRFWGTMFEAYENEDDATLVVDDDGNSAYVWTGEVV
jgi:hypothetical protein